ncbi:thiamine diphosphate-binding protein [Thelonectria olida]|uniref:2-oxoglutarate dehydrogenase, mitochondrial n=1 Tax=Thelonectria olida TaxID=1576542 RepID=A0A9P8WCZ4_9HYPO|nr:thiamine diphosphate-binding protein [Thelonectria olida]
MEELYDAWKIDPDSVHVSWRAYFGDIETKSHDRAIGLPLGYQRDAALETPRLNESAQAQDRVKVVQLISAYQSQGHYLANLDPLGLSRSADAGRPKELDPEHHGLTAADMDRQFPLGEDMLPFFARHRSAMTLREIVDTCESLYCGNYGVEYTHIPDAEKRDWLRERLEAPTRFRFSLDEKRRILDALIWAASFELFIATKFPTAKRFGLDGSEGLAPGIASIIDQSADVHGVDDIVIGSCHRGKLTMLGTVYGKPREAILAEFAGRVKTDMAGMAGDVKYHLGHDGHRITPEGRKVGLSLLANPSHLEAVDPVATGSAYASQQRKGDKDRRQTMCLALHGDAAFAGQGVVYETLGLSRLDAYHVGGTVRVVVNNQIGFTTDAECSRSTRYASDLAKYMDAPIIHVNANDVEAVTFVCQLAADWRAQFQQDIVIDLVCYRKHGHNEFDQPRFTQPMMYKQVSSQTPVLDLYVNKLVDEGSFTAEEIEEQKKWVWEQLKEDFEASKMYVSERTTFPPAWDALPSPTTLASETLPQACTAVDGSILKDIAEKTSSVPEGFALHPSLERILAGRMTSFAEGTIDWSTAEALAFGTLVLEGNSVRLTGQDVQRGTFSQRHLVMHDQDNGETWTPLSNLSPDQARFHVANSPLSEYGALGFEYGVTLVDPAQLVIWEAQFGDFANTAQVIIDNFVVGGESKWLDRSGLVLSLPHGLDGQGAEHSSARLERFLMMCGEEGRSWPDDSSLDRAHQDANISVVNMTSPANYFHALRRQVKRQFRKPLIVFLSKSLLRHPICRSDISEIANPSASFQPVLADPAHEADEIDHPDSISRVIVCSGQIYAALAKHRTSLRLRDAAIIRIEELHPFPWRQVLSSLDAYPNAQSIVWAQEEHYNGGAWHYMRDRLGAVLRKSEYHTSRRLLYAGRETSSSPATGWKEVHDAEEKKLLEDAFSVKE